MLISYLWVILLNSTYLGLYVRNRPLLNCVLASKSFFIKILHNGFMNKNFAIIILSHTYFVDLTNFVVTEVVVFDD